MIASVNSGPRAAPKRRRRLLRRRSQELRLLPSYHVRTTKQLNIAGWQREAIQLALEYLRTGRELHRVAFERHMLGGCLCICVRLISNVRSALRNLPIVQSKEALRRIRSYMQTRDQWQKVSSRICFYIALSEMASNRRNSCCSRHQQKELADLCGLSARTRREILRDLQSTGAISASGPKGRRSGAKDLHALVV